MAAEDFLIRFRVDMDFSEAEAKINRFSRESSGVFSQAATLPPVSSAEEYAARAGAIRAARQREMQLLGAPRNEVANERRRLNRAIEQDIAGLTTDPAEQARLKKLYQGVAGALGTEINRIEEVNDLYDRMASILRRDLTDLAAVRARGEAVTGVVDQSRQMAEKLPFYQVAGDEDDPVGREFQQIHTELGAAQRQLATAFYRAEARTNEYVQSSVAMEQAQNELKEAFFIARRQSLSYRDSLVDLEREADLLATTLNRDRLNDPDWVQNRAARRTSERTVTGAVREEQALDPATEQAEARITRANARIAEGRGRILLADDDYRASVINLTRYNLRMRAARQAILSGDEGYIRTQAELRESMQLAAARIRTQSVDTGAFARVATTRMQANIGERTALRDDADYPGLSRDLAIINANIAERQAQLLSISDDYIASLRNLTVYNLRRRASIQTQLAADERYLESQADLREANQRAAARVRMMGVESGAFVNTAQDRALAGTMERSALANDPAYLQLQSGLLVAGNELRTKLIEAGEAEGRVAETAATLAATQARQAADISENLVDTDVALSRARQQENLSAIEADTAAIRDTTTIARNRHEVERERTRTAAEQARLAQRNMVEEKANANVQRGLFRQRVRTQEIQHGQNEELIRLRAQAIISEQANVRLLQQQVVEQMRASGQFSRIDVMRAQLGAFTPGGGFGATGWFGGGLASTIRYGAPAALLYGGMNLITDTVREAEELDRIMRQLKVQLEATGRGEAFEPLRETILQLARDTGIAAQELGTFAVQMQGAFGNLPEGLMVRAPIGDELAADIPRMRGTELVEEQLRTVADLLLVTDMNAQDVENSVIATSTAFDVMGRAVADAAIALKDVTGTDVDETQNFMGRIGGTATELGFTMEQILAISGVVQRTSGVGGSALAEQLARILPAFNQQRLALLELALTSRTLNDEQFKSALAAGDTATAVEFLIENWQELTRVEQDFIVNAIGGRREAQTWLALVADPGAYRETLDHLQDIENTQGRLTAQADAARQTLSVQWDQLRESFIQLMAEVYDAGLEDLLKGAVGVLQSMVDVISLLISGWREFSDLLDLTPDNLGESLVLLGEIAAMVALINKGATAASLGAGAAGGAAAGAGGGWLARLGLGGLAGGLANLRGAVMPNLLRSPGLLAAGFTSGLTATNWAREQQRGKFLETEDWNIEQLNKLRDDELDAIAQQEVSMWERFRAEFFDYDPIPELAEKIGRIRENADAAQQARQMAGSGTEGLDRWSDALEQARIDDEEFMDWMKERMTRLDEVLDFEKVNDRYGAQIFDYSYGQARINPSQLEDPAILNKIIEDYEAGDEQAALILAALADINAERDDLLGRLVAPKKAIFQGPKTQERNRLEEQGQQLLMTLTDAQEAYKNGALALVDYVTILDRNLEELQRRLADNPFDTEMLRRINEVRQMRSDVLSNAIAEELDFRIDLAGIGMNEVDANQYALDASVAALRDENFTDRDGRLRVARNIIQLRQAWVNAQIENFDSAQEALDWLRAGNATLPPEARSQLIVAQMNQNSAEWGRFMISYQQIYGVTADAFMDDILHLMWAGEQGRQAAIAILREKMAGLASELVKFALNPRMLMQIMNAMAGFYQAIEDIEGGATTFSGTFDPGTTIDTSQQEEQQAEKAKQERERAAREAEQRRRDAERRAKELADAQADYNKALVEGDPVRAAQQAINDANRQYREAAGDRAGQLRAMAARIRAERQLQDALREIQNAQIELLMAQADYAGDTVRTAELGLEQARMNVERARADLASGAGGEADVIRAEAQLRSAQGRLRDEMLADRMDDYEYLYEMERITKQQLIQYLQSLKQIPDLTQDQIRDIDRRIKQLNQEMGQDLQFNLPTNLQLPTLYEARRLNQMPGGGGYQDNRNVTITLYVTDGMTADQAAQMVNEAVGGAGRVGTMVRRY